MPQLRPLIAVATAAIGLIALSGCSASGVTASPTATAATPSASASPDPLAQVDSVVVAGDGLHLHVGEKTMAVLDYRDEASDTIAALTELLGAPTGTSESPESNHAPATTVTSFGGLHVHAPHYGEPVTPDYVARPAWTVSVTASATGAIDLRTSAGLVVGRPFTDAKSAVGDFENALVGAHGTRTSRTLVEKAPGSPDAAGEAGGVIVVGDPDGGAITSIYAPGTLSAP